MQHFRFYNYNFLKLRNVSYSMNYVFLQLKNLICFKIVIVNLGESGKMRRVALS